MITYMDLEEVLDMPSVDGDSAWSVLEYEHEEYDRDHSKDIADLMREVGWDLRHPIVLCDAFGEEYDEDEGYWTVGDGHHRLGAAVLLGLKRVPVYMTSQPDEAYTSQGGRPPVPSLPSEHVSLDTLKRYDEQLSLFEAGQAA